MLPYSYRKTARSLLIVLTGILISVVPAGAKRTFEPVFNPNMFVSKTQAAISIDGNLDDLGWANASRADNFVERSPGDMTEPEVKTEAFVTYDEDHLYVAFLCYDDPAAIRATMCQRDQFYGDDAVAVFVDTYGDASWAYEFFVNPYGVQRDQLWTSVAGEDHGFDLIWQSAAQVTDSGYQVEIAVPFASMRFPNKDTQSWKVDFRRDRPRESFKQYSWAAYDRNEQCWVCQWGTIDGISNVRPGKGLEILSAVVGNQTGALADRNDPDSEFKNEKVDGELSLGGKYSLSSDMTLEATVNPDFSQIEADAAQVDVNTTIALFYPERRPFFQEGADIFRTLFNSFYTRTVNDPKYAAKLVGRTEKYNIGFLTALDENTPYMIPLEEGSILLNTGESYVNVLRGSRSIGEDNRVGFILSDRRLDGGGSGSIAAVDHDIRLSNTLRFDGQYILSHTGEPDDGSATEGLEGMTFDSDRHTVAFDGESYFGDAVIARIRRNARHLDFHLTYDHVSPSYRTEVGYDPVSNGRRVQFYSGYSFWPTTGLFERIVPQMYLSRKWNYDGTRKEIFNNFNLNTDLRFAQTNLGMAYNFGEQTWSGVEFEDLWHVDFYVHSRPSDAVGFSLDLEYGKSVARFALAKGNETSAFLAFDLKPFDRLLIEPNLRYTRSTHEDTGEELWKGYITRTRFSYQASKGLSVRLVVQYNDFNERWDIDPLLTYRLSSFSVFYLGSTYDYSNYIVGPNDQTDLRLSSRQFFAKLQYLFQI
ncbi:MAG: carbohydrate binding family 9 domain-containing protein [Candidatus Zixiibacteriota bacterium]|nr:MAG: carbohydrate binding family 9 domain-containing protein [candidate division Zixibacteria bacterium]